MCEAATIIGVAGVAVAAIGAGLTLYQQSEQADAQEEYQKRLAQARNQEMEENYKLAVASASNENKALQARAQQEGESATNEQMRNAREAAQAVATARTAAGEAGVSGVSVNALLSDFMAQESRYRESVNTNLDYARDSIEYELESTHLISKGRVGAIKPFKPSSIDQPNYLGGALRIGGAGLNAYNSYLKSQPATTPNSGSQLHV